MQYQNNKFYKLDNILSQHYTLNMICGDRSAGKTTAVQKYVLKRAISKKEEFAVIVRYDRDMRDLCETYFDNTLEMFYPDYDIVYMRKRFYLVNKKTEEKRVIGYCFALNMATKKKSTSYPHINTLIFEEFTNIEDKYIKSQNNAELEVELLLSLYSTIARGGGRQLREEVKIIMISNNYYLNNPYFRYYKLIDKIVKDPFRKFYYAGDGSPKSPKAIVEITHNENKLNYDIARDDTMIASSFNDLRNEIKIIKQPKVNRINMQLTLDNTNFISIANYNDSYIIMKDSYRQGNLCFSCSDIKKQNIFSINTLKALYVDMYKTLTIFFDNNWLLYDSVDTYITLYNIIHYAPS